MGAIVRGAGGPTRSHGENFALGVSVGGPLLLDSVQWTRHATAAFVQNVRVDHRSSMTAAGRMVIREA